MIKKTCDVCGRQITGIEYSPVPFTGHKCCSLCSRSGRAVRSLQGATMLQKLILLFKPSYVTEVVPNVNRVFTIEEISQLAGHELVLSRVNDHPGYYTFSSKDKTLPINVFYKNIYSRNLHGTVVMIHPDYFLLPKNESGGEASINNQY